MNIYYVTFLVFPTRSAHSIHTMKLCQALADNGHNVTLVAPDYSNKSQFLKTIENNVDDIFSFYNVKENFKIVKVPLVSFKGWKKIYPFMAARCVPKTNDTVVFTRDIEIASASTLYSIPTIKEFHYTDIKNTFLHKIFYNRTYQSKYLIRIVSVSEALKNALIKMGIAQNIIVAPDGSDLPKTAEKENLGQKFSYTLEAGYVGQLYAGKGLEIIINVAAEVPHVRFHIVGGNPDDIKKWQAIATKKKLTNIVFYGFVPQTHISKYINAFDVCLLPNQRIVSIWDNASVNISEFTSPLKMFDYMAHGKAIIASDLPVLREVLNENNAILCNPDLLEPWADALNYLANSKEVCLKLGKAALKDFTNKYSWKKRAETIFD